MTYKRYKVYPENTKLYFEVRIFASEKSMQKYLSLTRNTQAATYEWERYTWDRYGPRKTPYLGSVSFFRGGTPHWAIVHEMVHATMFYLKRKGIYSVRWDKFENPRHEKEQNKLEERISTIAGELVEQFHRKLKRIIK